MGELHLVGGCSPDQQEYLRDLTAAAAGSAVHLHVDADRATLENLYSRASVYWQGTGLGEDAYADPMRLEHFGIAVVEAMSAGAVPVVLGDGGPSEIVEAGRSGLHFGSVGELVDATALLLGDDRMLAELRSGAVKRAAEFSLGAFRDRLLDLVASADRAGLGG